MTTPATDVPAPPSPEIALTVDAGGIATNYHDIGDGATPVVLLHGSGPGVSAWANWRLTMPALAEQTRVLAPDIVGFGYTERPDGITYDLPTWVQHLADFVDALGLDRVGLVGNSFGGALALAFATRHPERVSRFVVMGSAGIKFELTEALDFGWGYEPSPANMRRLMELMAFDQSLVSDELAELRYAASIRPGVQEAFARMFPAPRERWIEALATPEEQLAALPHEALVVHGREDRIVPVESSHRLSRLIPRTQLHVFARCGHWTQIEQQARFNRLITDFFAEADR